SRTLRPRLSWYASVSSVLVDEERSARAASATLLMRLAWNESFFCERVPCKVLCESVIRLSVTLLREGDDTISSFNLLSASHRRTFSVSNNKLCLSCSARKSKILIFSKFRALRITAIGRCFEYGLRHSLSGRPRCKGLFGDGPRVFIKKVRRRR